MQQAIGAPDWARIAAVAEVSNGDMARTLIQQVLAMALMQS